LTPSALKAIPQTSEFTFNNQSFELDGKSFFLSSGEMHYFRIDAELWEKHLDLIKQAGLNTVSSYVPWSLHEQIEGEADFTDKYAANLNLERFIKLCKKKELNLIFKPGPYILAELSKHGIPRWFLENYPDAAACDSTGKPYPVGYACICHPDYLRKTMQWYDAVMPLIAENQISNGGPIAMIQVCNEVGLFQWLGGGGDYSGTSIKAYRQYLKKTYKTISALNERCGTDYRDFQDVAPPAGEVKTKAEHFAYQDWENFHRDFYADYIGMLIKEIRLREITVPLFHNIPGWVFGRAKTMPVCISMYHKLSRLYPDILLGVDHIPENPSYRNFHDDRIINAMTKSIQGNRGPSYVAELQAGTREANVRVYPNEMELFYKACLANGAVGMNYYMFSGGENPPGWGIYDSAFYLQTPIDAQGKVGESYPVIQRISDIVKTHGQRLCQCSTNAKQALVFYPPYYYREFLNPLFGGKNLDDGSSVGRKLDPQMVTDELLFDGVGKLLAMDNQEYDFADITAGDVNQLNGYEQIWAAFSEQMDAACQKKLLEYVRCGGHLICFPTLPKFNLNALSCTILADGLGVKTEQIIENSDGIIYWADTNQPIHVLSYIETFNTKSADVIAYAQDKKACGIKINCGKGSAAILGTGFIYQSEAHKYAWQKLSLAGNFKGRFACDNPLIITRTRLHKNAGGYFFALNYHNQAITTKTNFGGEIFLPPFSGLVLPFDMPVNSDFIIKTTTSEISNIQTSDKSISIEITGNSKTLGQMILDTNKIIKTVNLNDKPITFKQSGRNVNINYSHCDKTVSMEILW
jgi:beta-galactosidase